MGLPASSWIAVVTRTTKVVSVWSGNRSARLTLDPAQVSVPGTSAPSDFLERAKLAEVTVEQVSASLKVAETSGMAFATPVSPAAGTVEVTDGRISSVPEESVTASPAAVVPRNQPHPVRDPDASRAAIVTIREPRARGAMDPPSDRPKWMFGIQG